MELTVKASWEWAEPHSELWKQHDCDWLLEIAGYRAYVSWRADRISWDVFYLDQDGPGQGGSWYAPAGDEHGVGALTDEQSDELYERAKSAAEQSIREAVAQRNALV